MLWMSADLKEDKDIHKLWKLTDNQQLSVDQVSCSFKLRKKKKPLWWLSTAKSAARSPI